MAEQEDLDQDHNAQASKQFIAALLTEAALITAFDKVQVDVLLEEIPDGRGDSDAPA